MFIDKLPKLPGTPTFNKFMLKDRNVLGRTEKTRQIYAPNEAMRILHRWIIRYVRELQPQLPHATGARPGCSPKKNVERHRRSRYFYLVDASSAYLNVNLEELTRVIMRCDETFRRRFDEVIAFLTQYCSADGVGLATGAPASPDLFNLYAGLVIDIRMAPLCKQYGLTYTRYLDDFTFSSPKVPIGARKRRAIRSMIEGAGLPISHHKCVVHDLRRSTLEINGVGLEFGGRIFLPRHFTRRVRGAIHLARQGRISPQKLAGLMGVYFSTTELFRRKRTDMKLLREYALYRKELKEQKKKKKK
jgi:RNA-directed DNA polymerase